MTATAHNTAHRPAIAVTRHAIAAGHYLAATAGFDILQAGGNAIDAGVPALRRYGTMSFGEVAAAATRLARDGFPMYPLMAASLKKQEERLRSWPSTAAVLLPNGRAPQAGEVFRQTDLAASLQYMA